MHKLDIGILFETAQTEEDFYDDYIENTYDETLRLSGDYKASSRGRKSGDLKKDYRKTLKILLQKEIRKMSINRGFVILEKNGERFRGIPMAELKNDRFVFDTGGVMKAFSMDDFVLT
jgi:hypothetical protein